MADLFKENSINSNTNEARVKMSLAIGTCILENVELSNQMTVLDFGAGTGLIASQGCVLY